MMISWNPWHTKHGTAAFSEHTEQLHWSTHEQLIPWSRWRTAYAAVFSEDIEQLHWSTWSSFIMCPASGLTKRRRVDGPNDGSVRRCGVIPALTRRLYDGPLSPSPPRVKQVFNLYLLFFIVDGDFVQCLECMRFYFICTKCLRVRYRIRCWKRYRYGTVFPAQPEWDTVIFGKLATLQQRINCNASDAVTVP